MRTQSSDGAVSGDLTITKLISDKQEPLKEEENDLLVS